jgi:hypothetical protein
LTSAVDGEGFEPSKSETTDLQSVPFGHSGTRPKPSRDGRRRAKLGFVRAIFATELAMGLEPATC